MEDGELLAFMDKILRISSDAKASHVLSQLRSILEEQGAPERQLQLVSKADLTLTEIKQILDEKQAALTPKDLAVAEERRERRLQRERELAEQGRC